MNKIELPIGKERTFDVVIVGGGLGGCSAAIAAGRKGVKAALIEQSGILGGAATQGIVTPLDARKDTKDKPFGGIVSEISGELTEGGTRYCSGGSKRDDWNIASPYFLKALLLEKCLGANVSVFFHYTLLGAQKSGDEIECIYVLTKSGVEKFNAKVFIDGTGDGDLIEKSGAPYSVGCEKEAVKALIEEGFNVLHFSDVKSEDYSDRKLMQPVSIFFRLGGVDMEKAMKYNNKTLKIGDLGITSEKLKNWKYYNTCGFEESGDLIPLPQGRILVTPSARPDVAVVNMSRVTGIDGSDAQSLNEGEIKAQLQVIAIVDFLITFVDGFEKAYLIDSASTLGVRETRRLKGKTVLSGRDVINAKKLTYPVAKGSYSIDIHDPTGKGRAIGGFIKGDFYDIPYGSLITDDVPNLIVCGRCISADHVAHSSTRIQGTCMLTGQAAGTAAALSVSGNVKPNTLSEKLLHQTLIDDNVFLN